MSRDRYVKNFGPLNQVVSIANHSLVMIDAPGLVDEDYRRYVKDESYESWVGSSNGTIKFVNEITGGMYTIIEAPIRLVADDSLRRGAARAGDFI